MAYEQCVSCFNHTKGTVALYCSNKKVVLSLCDKCYYDYDDEVILPVPFSCLFGIRSWDKML